jgi:hypothetical protein
MDTKRNAIEHHQRNNIQCETQNQWSQSRPVPCSQKRGQSDRDRRRGYMNGFWGSKISPDFAVCGFCQNSVKISLRSLRTFPCPLSWVESLSAPYNCQQTSLNMHKSSVNPKGSRSVAGRADEGNVSETFIVASKDHVRLEGASCGTLKQASEQLARRDYRSPPTSVT